MTSKVLVPLAPGFEEIEAVTIIDVLRRASIDVTTASLEPGAVKGAHGITLQADVLLSDVASHTFDMVVLPGGMPGAAHLRDHPIVQAVLKKAAAEQHYTAAICAAPIALAAAGLTQRSQVTSYPGFASQIPSGHYSEDRVVVDGKVITSRGPGTALEFALTLVSLLSSKAAAKKLGDAMLVAP